MDPIAQLSEQIKLLTEKISSLERSFAVIKRVFIWMLIGMVLTFILPLIGLAFVVPSFLANYQAALSF